MIVAFATPLLKFVIDDDSSDHLLVMFHKLTPHLDPQVFQLSEAPVVCGESTGKPLGLSHLIELNGYYFSHL